MQTKSFQLPGIGLLKVLFLTLVIRHHAVTAMHGQQLVLSSLPSHSKTTALAPVVNTPETTSLSNSQLHAHQRTETMAAVVDGTTGFGITCKRTQSFKQLSILSRLETVLLVLAKCLQTQLRHSLRLSQLEPHTFKLDRQTLPFKARSWSSQFQSPSKPIFLLSNSTKMESSQRIAEH